MKLNPQRAGFELRYLPVMTFIGGVILAGLMILYLLFQFIFATFPAMSSLVNYMLLGLGILAVGYIITRFSTALPLIVRDEKYRLFKSWGATEGKAHYLLACFTVYLTLYCAIVWVFETAIVSIAVDPTLPEADILKDLGIMALLDNGYLSFSYCGALLLLSALGSAQHFLLSAAASYAITEDVR